LEEILVVQWTEKVETAVSSRTMKTIETGGRGMQVFLARK